jgi:hypothetical protein
MSYNQVTFKENCAILADNVESQANDIHTLALEALEQGNLHGNINPMVWLLAALGKKNVSEKVITWACAFGRFGTKKDVLSGKVSLVYQNKKLIDGTPFDAGVQQELANSTPYYDYVKPKAEGEVKVFDFEAELRKLLKTAADIKSGKKSNYTVIHDEYEQGLKDMLPEGKKNLTAKA